LAGSSLAMATPLAEGHVHQPDKGAAKAAPKQKAKAKAPKKDAKKPDAK
jgi:hypothetical protein